MLLNDDIRKHFPFWALDDQDYDKNTHVTIGSDGSTNMKAVFGGGLWIGYIWQEFSANGFWFCEKELPTLEFLLWFHDADFQTDHSISDIVIPMSCVKEAITPYLC